MKRFLCVLLTLGVVLGMLSVLPATAETGTLDEYLIAHWDFSGDNPLADKAPAGSTSDTMRLYGAASAANGAATVPDWANGGSEHYLYVENSADLLRTAEDRTIFIVFRSDKGDYANDDKTDSIELAGQNGALRDGMGQENKLFGSTNSHQMGENWCDTTGMTGFAANTWTTVAISYDKNADGTFSVTTCFRVGDGEWITTTVSKTDAAQTWVQDDSDEGQSDPLSLVFGRRTYTAASTWGGNLTFDDIRIYNRALSADEVKSIAVSDPESDISSAGHSLTLSGEVGVNFFLRCPAYLQGGEAVVTVTRGEEVLLTSGFTDGARSQIVSGAYQFTAPVAAKEMTDALTLTVRLGEQTLYSETYSVQQYGAYVLANAGQFSTETVALVRALLNYGAYAQLYFDYRTDALANAGCVDTPAEVDAGAIGAKLSVNGSVSGLTCEGATLVLDSKTAVVFRLKLDAGANPEDYSITGGACTRQGDVLYVQTEGLCAQSLDDPQLLTVEKDGETLTVSYSPMTYLKHMITNDGSAPDLLLRALYAYHAAATAYLA